MSDLQTIYLGVPITMPVNPGPPVPVSPSGVMKNVALAITPEYLAPAERLFRQLQFYPKKDRTTPNVGDVTIQIVDENGVFQDVETLQPGDGPLKWEPPPTGRVWNGHSFKIKVATDGDGVLYVYA